MASFAVIVGRHLVPQLTAASDLRQVSLLRWLLLFFVTVSGTKFSWRRNSLPCATHSIQYRPTSTTTSPTSPEHRTCLPVPTAIMSVEIDPLELAFRSMLHPQGCHPRPVRRPLTLVQGPLPWRLRRSSGSRTQTPPPSLSRCVSECPSPCALRTANGYRSKPQRRSSMSSPARSPAGARRDLC